MPLSSAEMPSASREQEEKPHVLLSSDKGGLMQKKPRDPMKNGDYHVRTRLIHGSADNTRWDYNHHVVAPISSSTTYRLNSTNRGVQGFLEFATDEAGSTQHVPI